MIARLRAIWQEPNQRMLLMAQMSLTINLLSALGHGALGLWMGSAWYLILGAYYALLAVMRFGVVRVRGEDAFLRRFCGGVLMALAVVLAQTVTMSHFFDRAARHHEIIMITLASWTFWKVAAAIINGVRARRNPSSRLNIIRSISSAAAASLASMQRSMIVTFGGMAGKKILNVLTGGAVCIYIFLLCLNMMTNGGLRQMLKPQRTRPCTEQTSGKQKEKIGRG